MERQRPIRRREAAPAERLPRTPPAPAAVGLLRLQQTAGNRAVAQLVRRVVDSRRVFALTAELDADVRTIEAELESAIYTEGVEERVLAILVRWSGEGTRPEGAGTAYWLDRLLTALASTRTSTLLGGATTYYDLILDKFDRADEVRRLRDTAPRFRGRDSAAQMQERAEQAQQRREEELSAESAGEWRENTGVRTQLPPTPENLAKARTVASGLANIPDEKLTPELRAVSRRIRDEGERVLLEGVHFITHEERERWKKALAQKVVLTLLELAAIYVGGEILAAVFPELAAAIVGADVAGAAAEVEVGQVAYGSTDLSRIAIDARRGIGLTTRNVTVFEYEVEGTMRTAFEASERGIGHAERRVWAKLEAEGVHPSQVRRIYSELQPCEVPGGYCGNWIGETFPQAGVTWSFEYGATVASRRAGVDALQEAIAKILGTP